MVKITDVAKKAGVVKSTVSNVLSGKKYVSEELRQKVLDACRELDFHPNFYASGLSSKTTHILALLLEASEQITELPFYGDLLTACVAEASAKGYSLLVYYEKDTAKLLATLRQGRSPIDGAVIMAPCANDERFAQLENDRIHCVTIGRPACEEIISYVDIDNRRSTCSVVTTVAETYHGPIYLLNSPVDMTISTDRHQGFCEALATLGRDITDRYVFCDTCSEEEAYQFAMEHLTPDCAIVTANARMCKGIYKAAEEKGLRIGKDVGVFALGRSMAAGNFTPKLSYGKQNYDQLGRTAIDILVDEIENQAEPRSVYAENILIFRDSTQK